MIIKSVKEKVIFIFSNFQVDFLVGRITTIFEILCIVSFDVSLEAKGRLGNKNFNELVDDYLISVSTPQGRFM